MGGIVSHVKQLLSSYQKKTDYRPEVPEVAEGTQVLTLSLSLSHTHTPTIMPSLLYVYRPVSKQSLTLVIVVKY